MHQATSLEFRAVLANSELAGVYELEPSWVCDVHRDHPNWSLKARAINIESLRWGFQPRFAALIDDAYLEPRRPDWNQVIFWRLAMRPRQKPLGGKPLPKSWAFHFGAGTQKPKCSGRSSTKPDASSIVTLDQDSLNRSRFPDPTRSPYVVGLAEPAPWLFHALTIMILYYRDAVEITRGGSATTS